MTYRYGYAPGYARRGGVATAAAALLSAVSANGWAATYAGALPAYSTGASEFDFDGAPQMVNFLRPGFDNTGAATTYTEARTIMKRIRQVYTTAGAATHLLGDAAGLVALDDVVYQGEVAAGVTNNSTLASPLAIGNWALRDRRVVDNSIVLEITAWHRDQIACVEFWATDGTTTTPSVKTSTLMDLTKSTDQNTVLGYRATVDTTTLADATAFTTHFRVWPRIGGASAILETTAGTPGARGAAPQTHYKHVAKAANPPRLFIAASGGVDAVVDANGVAGGLTKVSTTIATAAANPFATFTSAIQALKAATAVTGGLADGCIIHLMTGTHTSAGAPAAGTYQIAGEMIIERDPAAAASAVILVVGGSTLRVPYITIGNLTWRRTSTTQFNPGAGGRTASINGTIWDTNAITNTFWTGAPMYIDGVVVASPLATTLVSGTAAAHLTRGVLSGSPASVANQVDSYNMLGSTVHKAGLGSSARSVDNMIVAFCKCLSGSGFGLDPTFPITFGIAFVQTVFEFVSATTNPSMRMSADDGANSMAHFVEVFNTYAGAGLAGRHNAGYDETLVTYRTNRLWRQVGNIYDAYYTKHDWFLALTKSSDTAEIAQHVGSWSVMYQVGAVGNMFRYHTIAGTGPGNGPNGSETVATYGRRAKFTTSNASPVDPLFVDNKATTWNGTTYFAGAGGGDYSVASGSPAKGMVPTRWLPKDLAGNARAASNDTAGAYA